ncbi:MAG: hypothetical protein R3E32_08040 [Chitinophagales bacterium]
MKKLLLSLFLLIIGIQNTINDSSIQAFEIDNCDVLQKTLENWCWVESTPISTPSIAAVAKKNHPTAKAKKAAEKIIDEVPVADFRYTSYRPVIAAQNYDASLREIDQHRRTLAKSLQKAKQTSDIDQIFADAEYMFTNALTEHLLPKWYGTLWDFYGHCERPQEGFIACGYLVSTNLKHMGININHYTMAQQWPINMVQSLVEEQDIQHLYSRSRSIEVLETLGYGFYIVGLDKHVGFIRYDETGMTFIHSNYTSGNQAVVAEPIRSSVAYTLTQNYYLAKLSDNRDFLTKWLKGKRFRVVK